MIQAGAAAGTSAEPLPAGFCFLLSKERQIFSVGSVECYLPRKNPLVPYALCKASQVGEHKLSGTAQLNLLSGGCLDSNIFLSFSSQRASSRCGLLVNS